MNPAAYYAAQALIAVDVVLYAASIDWRAGAAWFGVAWALSAVYRWSRA